jgi:hypothetical protein
MVFRPSRRKKVKDMEEEATFEDIIAGVFKTDESDQPTDSRRSMYVCKAHTTYLVFMPYVFFGITTETIPGISLTI